MAKSVFTHRSGSRYDDLPERQYHFPRRYLRQVERSLGDMIVYYEPRRDNGRQSYVASARVAGIEADPRRPDHYYAQIDSFLQFPTPVPFKPEETTLERSLQNDDGSTNLGAFQWAVRPLSDEEFVAIVAFGTADTIAVEHGAQLREPPLEPFYRPVIEQLVSRPFRDRAFRQLVRHAYNDRCALTGLRIINGGGRSEIDAAHIQPVSENHGGPDSLRNGLALCKTAHWMFDRGLVTLDDNFQIVVAEKLVPAEARRLLPDDLRAFVPTTDLERPHPAFLEYHRDQIFKG